MNNEKIIDRIKKLLAMATHNRGNHYECEVAMKMAHRLMAEHKISEAQLNTSDKEIDCEYRSIVVKKKDHKTKLLAFIAWIMSEFFQTEVYSRPAEAVVVSTKDNIETAVYIFEYLLNNMRACYLAEKRKQRKLFRIVDEYSYYAGFYVGLSEKLREQKEEILEQNDSYALIIANETTAIKAFAEKELSPKKAHQHRDRKLEHNSLQAGFEKGKEFEINSALQ